MLQDISTETKTEIESYLKTKIIELKIKRGLDFILSFCTIIVFSPLLLITAILIKLNSPGPALYLQNRVGYRGRFFICYKFRSMKINSIVDSGDFKLAASLSEKGILYKSRTDQRITFIGKIIRKTSIDELPQLFNVLFGDMSMVGPRPLVPFMLKNYQMFSEIRSLVKPGITGLWQVRSREKNNSAVHMIKFDLEYCQKFNILNDLKILIKTIPVVLNQNGAH